MSPYAARVIPVYKDPLNFNPDVFDESFGKIEQLRVSDQNMMRQHDEFFDAWGEGLFIKQSRQLGFSFLEILNTRPLLIVPELNDGPHLECQLTAKPSVALCLAKYGAVFLREHLGWIIELLLRLLEDERLLIFNLYHSSYDFPHWPDALRVQRREQNAIESALIADLNQISPRIIPVANASLHVVAAVIRGSNYFIGVDNGLKHVAWALGRPLTYFIEQIPTDARVLRWMPDFHCAVLPGGDLEAILRKVRAATEGLNVSRLAARDST
jgi:hypothetical protein